MKEPPPPLSPDVALFLDFDGTLAELAPTPDSVKVADGIGNLLQCVGWGLNGALAIISGRPIAVIDRYVGGIVQAVAGISGAERRVANGQVHKVEVNAEGLDKVRPILARFSIAHPGVLVEDKGFGLAVHYRMVPTLADACRSIVAECALLTHGSLEPIEGKMVVELKPTGVSKAIAVAAYMNEPPFAGRRPVFVGDDIVDEDAFAAIAKTNGYAVIIGERIPTHATTQLPSVGALHAWLRDFCQRVMREEPTPAKGKARMIEPRAATTKEAHR